MDLNFGVCAKTLCNLVAGGSQVHCHEVIDTFLVTSNTT